MNEGNLLSNKRNAKGLYFYFSHAKITLNIIFYLRNDHFNKRFLISLFKYCENICKLKSIVKKRIVVFKHQYQTPNYSHKKIKRQ